VVNVACSEHERLQGEMEEAKSMKKMSASDGILHIIADHDVDGDGELSLSELEDLMAHDDFGAALVELDLNPEDLAHAFSVMDNDKSGSVTYVEFVRFLFKMKDSDASFMLETIKFLITQVKQLVIEGTEEIQNKLVGGFEAAEAAAFGKFVQPADGLRQSADTNPDASDDIQDEGSFVEIEMVGPEKVVHTNLFSEKFLENVTPPELLAVPTSDRGKSDTKSVEARHVDSLEPRPIESLPLSPHVDYLSSEITSDSCFTLSCLGSQTPQMQLATTVPQGGQELAITERNSSRTTV